MIYTTDNDQNILYKNISYFLEITAKITAKIGQNQRDMLT